MKAVNQKYRFVFLVDWRTLMLENTVMDFGGGTSTRPQTLRDPGCTQSMAYFEQEGPWNTET